LTRVELKSRVIDNSPISLDCVYMKKAYRVNLNIPTQLNPVNPESTFLITFILQKYLKNNIILREKIRLSIR